MFLKVGAQKDMIQNEIFLLYRNMTGLCKMIWMNQGSVCPSYGYLISESEKELFKILLADAKSNLKSTTLEQGGVLHE